ncbi:pilin [Patescibacteria group bacterium]|nr:pilin [Patescibacteria group bacterium]MBU1500795.1 pilin [Patescibacteria group bacterium]MBU2080850.1 pilin [Patescibacteria group bacterium]MBU2123955.1 pilin [Patescibacteria group bacterium]MBU2194754.1 pilin [Patescibacteria group bacterium]
MTTLFKMYKGAAASVVVFMLPLMVAAQGSGGSTGSGGTSGGPTGSGGASGCGAAGTGLKNPLNNICTLPQFLNAILDAVVQLGTIVLILALVYVGFQFVAAQGNEEKIRSARSALMWTVIGGLVLLGAKAIGLVIEGTVSAL